MVSSLLPPDWSLPPKILARLGTKVGRQRSMAADGHLLLLLHAPPQPGEPERDARLFWCDDGGEWRSNAFGTGIAALNKHLDEFAARVDALESLFERHRTSRDLFGIVRGATPLLRTTRHLLETLQQVRETSGGVPGIIDARDRANALARAIELVHGDAQCALDYEIAMSNEVQAKVGLELAVSSHRLNVMAAVFFPLVTLTGIFGMNLKSGLVDAIGPQRGFWVVVGAGVIAGALMLLFVRRTGGAGDLAAHLGAGDDPRDQEAAPREANP